MARPTEWRRGYAQFIDNAAETAFAVQIGAIATGETLTRLRYRWQAAHLTTFDTPAEAITIIVGLGIIDLPVGTDPSEFPYPLTNPDAEWIAYEHDFFLPYTVRSSTQLAEIDLAPADPSERDSKAQRVSGPLGRELWAMGEVGSGQAISFWTLGWSSLFLLPAT